MTTIETTVVQVRRLRSSGNGNPAWEFRTDDGRVLRTGTDAQVGYEVTPGWQGDRFRFWLEDGEVWRADRLPNS